MARVLDANDPEAMQEAVRLICDGRLVAFPTETVYGLGADAENARAVARIFEVKRRPSFDPLIVHVADPDMARLYGALPDRYAADLIAEFWPGPLTLVVPKTERVPPIVTAGLATVGLRMPAHGATLSLIRATARALAAPSANPFGSVSPTEAAHVAMQLPEVDLILDGGRCAVGLESTVLSLAGPRPRLLRPGGVPIEEIERITGPVAVTGATDLKPEAPGQLARHYATRTRLEIRAEDDHAARPLPGEKVGLLSVRTPRDRVTAFSAVEILSDSGDLREAAANLFAALFRLDSLDLDRLVAFPVPERGLGAAIMDRLRRCSAK